MHFLLVTGNLFTILCVTNHKTTNMRIAAVFILGLSTLLVSSCRYVGGKRVDGNGNRVTVNRTVGDFDGVEVRGGIDVVLTTGNDYGVRIEADENLIDYIEVHNEGGTIRVGSRDGHHLRSKGGIKVYATAPRFETVGVSGSGDIRSVGKVVNDRALELQIKGSGDIQLAVDAPRVATRISGSGSAKLEGTTREFRADINGSGDVHAFGLLSESASVDIAGSGNAEVFASKQLSVEIKGAGDVAYKGTGAVSQRIVGSGSVRQVQ